MSMSEYVHYDSDGNGFRPIAARAAPLTDDGEVIGRCWPCVALRAAGASPAKLPA